MTSLLALADGQLIDIPGQSYGRYKATPLRDAARTLPFLDRDGELDQTNIRVMLTTLLKLDQAALVTVEDDGVVSVSPSAVTGFPGMVLHPVPGWTHGEIGIADLPYRIEAHHSNPDCQPGRGDSWTHIATCDPDSMSDRVEVAMIGGSQCVTFHERTLALKISSLHLDDHGRPCCTTVRATPTHSPDAS